MIEQGDQREKQMALDAMVRMAELTTAHAGLIAVELSGSSARFRIETNAKSPPEFSDKGPRNRRGRLPGPS